MIKMKHKRKTIKTAAIIVLSLLLAVSVGINIYLGFFGWDSYLQSTDEIYVMESGILRNNLAFTEGEDYEIVYDFDHEEYPILIEQYHIDEIAGEGSEFERALNLMNEYAPRLTHKSNYDNHVEMNAPDLLEYSLDNKNQGINCRSKAQILNEMCLALGIYSRKVWIMPNSGYDNDCHVVNEVWDSGFNKWIMLDITNNQYWVDENGEPLSITEIRTKGAMHEFCTPVTVEDDLGDIEKLKERHIGEFLYIMKNMVYMYLCDTQTVDETEIKYMLFPENLNTDYEYLISEESWSKPPVK